MLLQRIKELPWWAISLSLGVNVISLIAAVAAIQVFRTEIPVIVLVFLFIHIFVSQPLKDWIISRMGMDTRYSAQTGFVTFENRLARLTRLRDVLDFLSWLIRAWKLARVRLLVFDEEDFVYFFTRSKRARKMRIRDDIPESYRQELATGQGGRPVSALSAALRGYMQSRKVKYVVPVLFRERLIGLIGLNEIPDRNRISLLDHAAHRIGLALENEQLERTVPRSEFLTKEFRLAEKIERHLSGGSTVSVGGYTIQKLDTAWEKKHFSAIFGCAPAGDEGEERHFLMLMRLSVASTRSNALQLFSTQGYFYSLSRGQADIINLANSLHINLRLNENRSVVLEGFLISLHPTANRICMLAFGSHLAYRDQSGWTWIRESHPLGADQFEPGPLIELSASKDIILSMREYPLLMINGGHA